MMDGTACPAKSKSESKVVMGREGYKGIAYVNVKVSPAEVAVVSRKHSITLRQAVVVIIITSRLGVDGPMNQSSQIAGPSATVLQGNGARPQ